MPDPLTVECFCAGEDAVACTITSLKLIVRMSCQEDAPFPTLELSCDGASTITITECGNAEIELSPLNVWLDGWNSIEARFKASSTLTLGRSAQLLGLVSATVAIQVTWDCDDGSTGVDTAYGEADPNPDVEECMDDVDGLVNIRAIAKDSGFTAMLFQSRALNSCTETDWSTIGNFEPNPAETQKFKVISISGQWCACPSGGVPPYRFYLTHGSLACGQTLNTDSGCIEGAVSGDCDPASKVTFQVQDSAGNIAVASCNWIESCGEDTTANEMF